MTEEDVKETQDKAIVRYIRAKKQSQVASARLSGIWNEMDSVAKDLRLKDAESIVDLEFASFEWLNPEKVKDRARDAATARTELLAAREDALKIGAPID